MIAHPRRSIVVGFVLALALAQGAAAAAQDFLPDHPEPEKDEPGLWFRRPNVGYGPFHYDSLSLFPSLRPGLGIRFPTSLAAGTFDLRLTESWVKNAAVETDWRMNFEVVRSNIALDWHVTDWTRLEVAVDSSNRTGGGLDAVILGFHDAFGIAIGSRNQFSRNANRIEIRPPDGGPPIVIDESDPQPFQQAALLTLQQILTYGDEVFPAVSASLTVRRHLDDGNVRTQGPVDLGASLSLSKQVGPFTLTMGGSFAWFGRESLFGLKLRTTQRTGMAGLEWNIIPPFSLIGQFLVTSGGVDDLQHLSEQSYEVIAGFKWEFWTGMTMDFAIVENVINFRNAPDFGINGGLTLRW